MKKNAPQRRDTAKRSAAVRPSKGNIRKKAGRKSAASKPTYFSLLKDVEHALRHKHTKGAHLHKIKRHLEKRHGGKFDAESMKMLRSAVKRLHKKGRIKKHPTSHFYKFKPPIVPAHHIFGTPKQRREGRALARARASRSRPNRSSKPARKRR